jgi:CheY-like chemotaxis protein
MTEIRRPPFANVRPLHPIRVLLCSTDVRFVRVTKFLLARAGFVVHSCSQARVHIRVRDLAPHVVVVDASGGTTAAVRIRSAFLGRRPPVAVVLVSDDPAAAPRELRALPKWDQGEELVHAIERAYLRLPHDEGLLRGAG